VVKWTGRSVFMADESEDFAAMFEASIRTSQAKRLT
jgi:hypothetical protein